MVDSLVKSKIISKLTKVVEQKPGSASMVHPDKLRSIPWLFDYVEANVMTYGHLWTNMQRNMQRVMAAAGKNIKIVLANMEEVKRLRKRMMRRRLDNSNRFRDAEDDTDEEDETDEQPDDEEDGQRKRRYRRRRHNRNQREHDAILELLDEAIANCPLQGNGKIMARLFYLRGWQMAWVGQFRAALRNINFAFKFARSKKYYLHKAIYLQKLNHKRRAIRLLAKVLDRDNQSNELDSSDLDADEFKRLVAEQLDCHDTRMVPGLDDDPIDQEEEEEEEEEEVGWSDEDDDQCNYEENFYMDKRCQLKWSESQGRHFVAREPIPAERTIFRERAYSTLVLPEKLATRCGHCFRSVANVFWPCTGCNETVYCGSGCQRKANQSGHRYECKVTRFFAEQSKSTFHMFKMLSKIGISKILEIHAEHQQQQSDSEKNGSGGGGGGGQSYTIRDYICDDQQRKLPECLKDEQTKCNAYRAFLDLVHHSEKFGMELTPHHFGNALDCAMVAGLMQGYQIEEMPRADLVRLLEISFEGIRRTLVNSFRWSEPDDEAGQHRSNLGTCVCIVGSLFNHRCDYNADWTFEKATMSLVTNRDVEAGEEITICYGLGSSSPFEERLRQNRAYFFQCNCNACFQDAQTVLALSCDQCQGPVVFAKPPVTVTTDDCDDDDQKQDQNCCMLCQAQLPDAVAKYWRQQQIRQQIDVICPLFGTGIDRAKYLRTLLGLAGELSRLLYHNCLILLTYLDKCCRIFHQEGQIKECILYGYLIDRAMPMLEKLDPSCRDEPKSMSGPTKAVVTAISHYLDMMIFWSDVFRNHLLAVRDGSSQPPLQDQDHAELKVIMIRFFMRTFRLLDHWINRQRKEMESLDAEANDKSGKQQQIATTDDSGEDAAVSSSSGGGGQTEKAPQAVDFVNVGHSYQLKLLMALRNYKQEQLDSVDDANIDPKIDLSGLTNPEDLHF